ncbi:MAG: ABC transporter substrate-binding protein [Synechococcales cyanobacterium CRU_2_2]|nr:ABC transporter substrate-binding protein [Synechococcales cyanobacterium CRU_2_2]
MLRGIAQAQDKARELGINGISLEIVIADDNNDIATAQEIAPILAADPMILAVIGSNASGPSLSSAPIYQQTRIVMISPTSFSGDLSGFGDYIFRTIPNISSQVKTLASYAVNQSKKQRFLICSDTGAMDNQIFQQEFTQAVISLNVEVLPTACDIAQPSFDAAATLKQAISQGADALLIAPHVDYPERGIQLAQAAQGKLALFASPTLYNSTLLSAAGNNLKNLVIAAPWYADSNSTTSFLAQAQQRWGDTSLTWRTATSFDATMAIAAALGQIPPEQPWGRSQLQQQLRSPGFKAQGAGETVQFLPTGDRAGKAILLRVQKRAREQGYEFKALT